MDLTEKCDDAAQNSHEGPGAQAGRSVGHGSTRQGHAVRVTVTHSHWECVCAAQGGTSTVHNQHRQPINRLLPPPETTPLRQYGSCVVCTEEEKTCIGQTPKEYPVAMFNLHVYWLQMNNEMLIHDLQEASLHDVMLWLCSLKWFDCMECQQMVSLTRFIIWHTVASLPGCDHLLANNSFGLMVIIIYKILEYERERGSKRRENMSLHQLENKTF